MKNEWSKYQREIFDTYRHKDCNIAIQAGPGSGKSTVLVQLCKLTPLSKRSVFLAFNGSIVEELKEKLPSSTYVKTLHGLGCSILWKEYGNIKVVESKTFGVLKRLESKWKEDLRFKDQLHQVKNINYYLFGISQLYDLYRMNLLTDTKGEIISLADRHGIETNPMILHHLTDLVHAMSKINRITRGAYEIDYLDMIYLPIAQKLTFPRYDVVFLDEAQDLNKCQHTLVDKLLGRYSRLVSVGDPNQCIYAFLGADTASFEKLSKRPNTVTLPLSITYRCPKKIVEKINEVYDVVQAAPNAIEGDVREGDFSEIEEGDMVLCRNNKPLLIGYFKLLADEKKSFIKGAEFGKGIIRMITPYKQYHTDLCIDRLYGDLDKLEEVLRLKEVFAPRKHKSYLSFQENIELIKVIADRYQKVSEIIPVVERIFKNDGQGIMLSSIHKAKGLEADRVFLVNPELIPSKYAEQDWEKEQEQKLLFVAYSRPKKELVFIRNFQN